MSTVNMPEKKEGALDTGMKAFEMFKAVKGIGGGSGGAKQKPGDAMQRRQQSLDAEDQKNNYAGYLG